MKTIISVLFSLCFTTILQAQISKTAYVTAGNLKIVLTADELNTVTNLNLTGAIDARDFKTMRDDMPVLSEIDMSGVTIAAYSGNEGTSWTTDYPANAIPQYALYQRHDWGGGRDRSKIYNAHQQYALASKTLNPAKSNLTTIILPTSINAIGQSAFENCSGLSSISIPPSVASIGNSAFFGCSSLASLELPPSLTSIEYNTLQGCASLTDILIPASVTSVGSGAFQDCTGLTTVTIPSSVTTIGSYAFAGCSSLASLELPPSLTSIEYSTLQGCSRLTDISIPSSVTFIGSNAFAGCSSLASLKLPPSLTSIESGLFADCAGLSEITLPPSVTSIGNSAFLRCGSLTSLELPASLTSIEYSTLQGCSRLTDISIPSSVTFIGSNAFANCSSLASLKLPPSLTSIESGTLEECTGLTEISIPPSVTSIGDYAFDGCRGLTTIIIPGTVTSIGSYAFANCSGLTSVNSNYIHPVNLNSSPGVFSGINKNTCTLYVPYKTEELYVSADQWKEFTKIVEATNGFILNSNIIDIASSAGSTSIATISITVSWKASSDQTWLTVKPGSGTGDQILIFTAKANPFRIHRKAQVIVSTTNFDSQIIDVKQAASNAPLNNTAGELKTNLTAEELANITKLTVTGTIDARDFKTMRDDMPLLAEIDLSSITVAEYTGKEGTAGNYNATYHENFIPEYAFHYNSHLTSIVFPKSIITIGMGAFNECIHLTSVDLPPSVRTLEQNVFSNCKNLNSVTIPEGVIIIGNQAFYQCAGTFPIFIPSSVFSIDGAAFTLWGGSINVDEKNPYYSSSEGVLFNKFKTELIVCPGTKTGNYTIPSTVMFILPSAFDNCSGLSSVIIPSSVRIIKNYAFAHCSGLTSVTLPSSVTRIDNGVFNQCVGLNSIYVYSRNPVDLSNSQYVFEGINKTTCTLYVPYGTKSRYAAATEWKDFTNIVEMEIPEGLQDIAENSAQLKCYPNPATNKISITTKSNLQGETIVCIFNMNGAILQQDKFQSQNLVEMDVSTLAKGIYLLQIQTKAGVETKKLVVQ
jgi:hypothetical protein